MRIVACLLIALSLLSGCVSRPNTVRPTSTPAIERNPEITLSPDRGSSGNSVQVSGSGWPINKLVMIHLEDDEGRSGFIASANSNASGRFNVGFTWPVSERWQQSRSVTVLARSADDRNSAQASYLVISLTPSPEPTLPPTEEAESTPTTPEATEEAVGTPTPLPTPAPITSADVTIERLQFVPTLDGNLSEWRNVQAYQTPFVVEQLPEWDGILDADALWRLGWTPDALYIGVSVQDELLVQENIPQFSYYGDSLELEIDTEREQDLGPEVSPDDYQYVITPGDFNSRPASVYRFHGNTQGRLADAPATMAAVAAQLTATGYNLEIVIPWRDMNVVPRSGLVLGATLGTNDNDTPGLVEKQFVLLSNVSNRLWSTPDTWGTLTLE